MPDTIVAAVATVMDQLAAVLSVLLRLNVCSNKTRIIVMICKTVLIFPSQLAAITLFFKAALSLKDVTKNSLIKINIKKTESISFSSTQHTIAEVIKILSARGSRNFPKLEIRLNLRAMKPSIASVKQAKMKIIREIILQVPLFSNLMKKTKNGTIAILSKVSKFAAFIIYTSF